MHFNTRTCHLLKLCALCCFIVSIIYILWITFPTKIGQTQQFKTDPASVVVELSCSNKWSGPCSVWNGTCCEMPIFGAYRRGDSVRVLAMLERSRTTVLNYMTCVYISNNSFVQTTPCIGRVIWSHQASHQTVLFTCKQVATNALWVCVKLGETEHCGVWPGTEFVPVNNSFRSITNTTGVCTKVTYGQPDMLRIIEWIELNIILGADKIYMYNSSIQGVTNDALQYYKEKGLVDVKTHSFLTQWCIHRFSKSFPTQDYYLDWQLELLSLNDCLYTSSHEYLIVIDIDEILYYDFANDVTSYNELLKTLPEFRNSSAAGFVFRTAVYSDELYISDNINHSSSHLHTITHNRRTPIDWESPKSIIIRERCKALGHHICMEPERGFIHRKVKDTPTRVGHVRHYRERCRLTGEPGKCKKLLSRAVVDKGLKPWEQLLAKRMQKTLEEIESIKEKL